MTRITAYHGDDYWKHHCAEPPTILLDGHIVRNIWEADDVSGYVVQLDVNGQVVNGEWARARREGRVVIMGLCHVH